MNPNYNRDPKTGQKVLQSENMVEHCKNVWQTYIENAGFAKLFIIAHSAGGRCLSAI